MKSLPPPGECIHCGKSFQTLTWDHVFPKSWYPDTTPPYLEKWQIPACGQCNKDYGKLEEDLLIRIGLCLDPNDYSSTGISEKVLRALNPAFAKSEKDRRHRESKRKKILREVKSRDQLPIDGFFPHFDDPSGNWEGQPMGLFIRADFIEKITQKIIKGITYLEDGYIIHDPYRVNTFVLRDSDAQPFVDVLQKFGKAYSREPGIVVSRAVAIDDGQTAIYSIEIWGRLKLYAHVGEQSQ